MFKVNAKKIIFCILVDIPASMDSPSWVSAAKTTTICEHSSQIVISALPRLKITLNWTWIWNYLCIYCGDDWQIESHWSHEVYVSGIQAGDCLEHISFAWMKMSLNIICGNESNMKLNKNMNMKINYSSNQCGNEMEVIITWSQARDCIEKNKFAWVKMNINLNMLRFCN